MFVDGHFCVHKQKIHGGDDQNSILKKKQKNTMTDCTFFNYRSMPHPIFHTYKLHLYVPFPDTVNHNV